MHQRQARRDFYKSLSQVIESLFFMQTAQEQDIGMPFECRNPIEQGLRRRRIDFSQANAIGDDSLGTLDMQ